MNRIKGEMCTRCGQRPRHRRSSGRLISWCSPCESAQKAEYMRSAAGHATVARYRLKKGLPLFNHTEETGSCLWCGEPISRRFRAGAGNRKFCNRICRQENKKYSFLFSEDKR